MFCPKCGSQNADETKFCRGCGADLSTVLSLVEGKAPKLGGLAEKHIELYSRGVRGLLLGFGFLIISGLAFAFRSPTGSLWLFMLAFSFMLLATGISRFVQARGLKALDTPVPDHQNRVLTPGQSDYIRPSRSIYDTDDLVGEPSSVTERTTTLLDPEHGDRK